MKLQPIDYAAGGRSFTGFLADGSRGQTVPGILIAHEASGLDANAKRGAERLGALGFVAFAMDLYGEKPQGIERMRELSGTLRADPQRTLEITTAALAVLTNHQGVDPERLGAVGYCFGGTVVLDLARSGAALGCVVGFHAGLTTSTPAAAKAIRGKVLICHGADDPVIGADQREAFVAEMNAAGVDWQMHLYGGVGHSFTNEEIDDWGFPGFAYHATADRRSWQAMLDLFGETFGPMPG